MIAYTFSSYINAFTLAAGLKRLGVTLHTTDKHPYFPIPTGEVIADDSWLFFTEEASLRQHLSDSHSGRFLPARFPIQLLDDKWQFAEWLRSKPQLINGLDQWRISEISSVRYPCLVKAKNSWFGQRKLPRGWICQNIADIRSALDLIEQEDLPTDLFFIQEWLGDETCQVISVCGFHDTREHTRNLSAVVKRVAAHTTGLSCSSAVESVPDQWSLLPRACAILDTLEFIGPYELEFLVAGDKVRILELNPRFWMQHAIFLVSNNGLIKRYLRVETEADRQRRSVDNILWIDGIHLVSSVFRFKCDGFFLIFLALDRRLLRGRQVVLFPDLTTAARLVWKNHVWPRGWRLWNRLTGQVCRL